MNYSHKNISIGFEELLASAKCREIEPPPHFFDIHPKKCSLEELRELWKMEDVASRGESSLSLYIHIPFCQSRCAFCMYDSHLAKDDDLQIYTERIIKEYSYWREELSRPLKSLYIGGGTPSILTVREIDTLFHHLNGLSFLPNSSRTFETSPQSLTVEKLNALANTVVNRISIGVQSFDEAVMSKNKRPLSSKYDIDRLVSCARKMGFEDVNVDLMVGLEGQNVKNIEEAVRNIVEINPLSVTIYTYRDVHRIYKKNIKEKKKEVEEQLTTLFHLFEKAGWRHMAGGLNTEYNVFYAPDMTKDLVRHPTSIDVFRNIHLVGLGIHAHGFTPAVAYTNQSSCLSFRPDSKDYLVYRHTKKQQQQIATVMMLYCNNMQIDESRFESCFGVSFDEVFPLEMQQLRELKRVVKTASGFEFVYNSEYEAEAIRRMFWDREYLNSNVQVDIK